MKQENDGLTHFGADARLCSSDKLIAVGNILLCKECTVNNRAKEVISADKALDKYIEKTTNPHEKQIIDKLFKGFRKHIRKSVARDKEQFIRQSSIMMNKTTRGITSEITY